MKKICLLAFSTLIFLLSFSVFSVRAQEQKVLVSPDSQEETPLHYTLPYPGLLPDSPLYFFRVVRDRIVNFLIADPKRKAEFGLLQADKRLNAGISLFDKNKFALSITTISKAENYFDEALESVRIAVKEGIDVSDLLNKLNDSSRKHQQVLKDLGEKSPKEFKAGFESEYKRVSGFQKEVNSLILKR